MKKRSLAAIAVTLWLSVAGYGQTAEPKWFAPQLEVSQIKAVGDAFGNQVVKGKPFSATEERHSVQMLANGTRIENTQSNRLYRDNDGRTRIEDMSGVINIVDPLARFRAELIPKTKVARRSALGLRFFGTSQGIYRSGAGGRGSGAGVGSPPAQGAEAEDLGTQNVNGVLSRGSRTTVAIPRGQIGNDREIKVVTEQWFSDDLGLLVRSINSDPRFGDTTYQLSNIVQAAPDPSLFQIPADYTVTGTPALPQAPGQSGGRGGRGGPAQ
jgi:hypothetical protein